MAPSDSDTHHHRNSAPLRANIVLIGFLLIGGYYLVTEHRAHLVGFLPLLLPLGLCLGMHFFMHDHGHTHDGSAADTAPPEGASMQPPSQGTPR
jgi:hypothetical protein